VVIGSLYRDDRTGEGLRSGVAGCLEARRGKQHEQQPLDLLVLVVTAGTTVVLVVLEPPVSIITVLTLSWLVRRRRLTMHPAVLGSYLC